MYYHHSKLIYKFFLFWISNTCEKFDLDYLMFLYNIHRLSRLKNLIKIISIFYKIYIAYHRDNDNFPHHH